MKTILIRAALACAALTLSGTAMAGSNPIPGVDIIVRKNPGNNLVIHTDGSGRARIEGLAPGNYTLTVGGQSLTAAMDRLAGPARRSGIVARGGSRGGGSGTAQIGVPDWTHQDQGRTRTGDGRAAPAGPSVQVTVDLGPAGHFSRTALYRRGHAGEGLTLAFTIPNRGGARPSLAGGTVSIAAIGDQAGAGSLASY